MGKVKVKPYLKNKLKDKGLGREHNSSSRILA
jgi:hypothetical protein